MTIAYQSEKLVVFESALYRTTTTLVIGDDYLLLVDPNWLPIEVMFIADFLEPLRAGRNSYLLFTHSDYDHIIGYGRFADFTTIASQAFVDNPAKEKVLSEIRTFDDENYICRDYPIEYPDVTIVAAKDDTRVSLTKATELIIQQAPGHNADGIMAYLPDLEILIVGDYLCNVEFPFLYHSLPDYRATLNKIAGLLDAYSVKYLIPGHGDISRSPTDMQARLSYAGAYLDALEAHVCDGKPFPLDDYLSVYAWPEGLRRAHADNVALVRKELNKGRE